MGADAVIAMTPYLNKIQDDNLIVEYYQAISDAARIPVFVQNHGVGSELSVGTMAGLSARWNTSTISRRRPFRSPTS